MRLKTLKEIDKEISDKTLELKNLPTSTKPIIKNSIIGKIKRLRLARKYIETNPSIESVKRQMLEVENRTSIIDNHYKEYIDSNTKINITKDMFYKRFGYSAKDIKKVK